MSRRMRAARCAAVAGALVGLHAAPSAQADVGDVIAVVMADPSGVPAFCSVGLAFDGSVLHFDRCGDPLIYQLDPLGAGNVGSFNPGIAELPNAMAFDAKRNGLWIGCQNCNADGMPIYFWDFDDNSVTLQFTISFGLINPATGNPFLAICFIDGLAYNENDPNSDLDDEVWVSDDVDDDLALFRPNGTLVAGYDATTVDPSLGSTSGLAVGGPNLYMANNGGGDVFRAQLPALIFLDQFTSGDTRQEDMECDPVTFAPTEVMWVRTTPQGGVFPDVITAYEIEPGTCGLGGEEPGPATTLDIKPGSCPNSFNRGSNGVLPVALTGSDTFDVTEVDLATLALARADGMAGSVAPLDGPPGPGFSIEDVATPFTGELCDCHEEYGDGFDDLSIKFRTPDVVANLDLDSFAPGDLVELTLTGELLDGTPFSANDCIRLVPPGTPPGQMVVSANVSGVFIDASPLDLALDGGGFGTFSRTYPLSTVVTLSAPLVHQGWTFVGWRVGPAFVHDGDDPPMLTNPTIELTINGDIHLFEPIYRPRAAIRLPQTPVAW